MSGAVALLIVFLVILLLLLGAALIVLVAVWPRRLRKNDHRRENRDDEGGGGGRFLFNRGSDRTCLGLTVDNIDNEDAQEFVAQLSKMIETLAQEVACNDDAKDAILKAIDTMDVDDEFCDTKTLASETDETIRKLAPHITAMQRLVCHDGRIDRHEFRGMLRSIVLAVCRD